MSNFEFSQYFESSANIVAGNTVEFGGKAANLAELQNAGFPVPKSIYIDRGVHEHYLETGQLPADFIAEFTKIRDSLGGEIAVRSSANIEDGSDLSMAGIFDTHYITVESPDELALKRIVEIYEQSRSQQVAEVLALHDIDVESVKIGIVLQQLIRPKYAGVIYTSSQTGQIIVKYIDDFGKALVDGDKAGSEIIIDYETGHIASSAGMDDVPIAIEKVTEIADIARRIDSHFAGINQDIEFALDSNTDSLYILQARTLTTDIGPIETEVTVMDVLERTQNRSRRLMNKEIKELETNGAVFSDSNFSELLPAPTEADFGVFAYIFTGSDNVAGAIQIGRRDVGYLVGDETIGFAHYIGGKPYMSIARDAGTFFNGIPEDRQEFYRTLVNRYLDDIGVDRDKGIYPEMGLYLQDPTIDQLEELFPERGEEYYQRYLEFTKRLGREADTYLEYFTTERGVDLGQYYSRQAEFDPRSASDSDLLNFIEDNLEYLRTRACVDFVKAARLGFYYTQRLMVELSRTHGYGEDKVRESVALLTQGLEGSKITDVNLIIAQAEDEDLAVTLAESLIGHYSSGEVLEIRHPRFSDKPDSIIEYVRGIRESGDYSSKFEQQRAKRLAYQTTLLEDLPVSQRDMLEKIINNSQMYMALRETVKYYFTKGYAEVRRGIIELAQRRGITSDEVFHLFPRELKEFAAKPDEYRHLIRARSQEYTHYKSLDLPKVFTLSDVDDFNLTEDDGIEFSEAIGKFIAQGEDITDAVIINLEEFDLEDIAFRELINSYRENGIPVILAAKQVNLTHDPYINMAAGLILENADIVSHGAQRARELGIGAISAVRIGKLKTGTRVSFSPSGRLLKKLTSNE